ncbi:hypothetical protein NBT05_01535 [Aquimarina sp. ERC-38]|uniref:hypothetical protein n=1 Tax=Aquimarina sp. ERC-38 TaxID=2949996 RepID=UPI00224729F6|nr:hypothetical protein [Aquimarina sp. ERC-38]UZO81169.1 hypothetical protein NBT05_01535 [Aquimarina sp. ERC-38]
MKRIAIIIILCSGLANAQDFTNNSSISEKIETLTSSTQKVNKNEITTEFKKPEHYRETSKVAFYEVLLSKNNFNIELKEDSKISFYQDLLSKNNFDIQLKDNTKVALKNTEEMVKKLKNRTMVASN